MKPGTRAAVAVAAASLLALVTLNAAQRVRYFGELERQRQLGEDAPGYRIGGDPDGSSTGQGMSPDSGSDGPGEGR